MIPKGATRILMAAEVQGSLESLWEMSLIEMRVARCLSMGN